MLLSRDTSQLLIVDVQTKLLPAMSDQRLVERCILVRAAKALGVPITIIGARRTWHPLSVPTSN